MTIAFMKNLKEKAIEEEIIRNLVTIKNLMIFLSKKLTQSKLY